MLVRDIPGCMDFQGAYIKDMIEDSGYKYDVDCDVVLKGWLQNRLSSGVCGYRNFSHPSIFTKKEGVKPKIPYMENKHHGLKEFLAMY